MGQVLVGGGVTSGFNVHLSRLGLLASTCVAALIVGSAAIADPSYYTGCGAASSGSTVTCTVPAGAQGTGVHIDFTGANGTNGVNAAPGGAYTLNNNANFTTAGGQNEGLFVRSRGGVGNADVTKGGTRGGDGGVVTITNTGTISFGALSVPASEGSDDGSNPGVWDDPGRAVAIYGASIGGTGGGGQGSVGGGNGGNGGHAGPLTITNSGTLDMGGVTMTNGGAGILASVVTGGGGEQNDTAGDQHGGAAGDGNALTVTNSGAITLNAPSAGHYVWGIGGENLGGVGGQDNGNGGTAGTTTITNSGVVSVTVQAVASGTTIDEGVRGIYGASFGGPGEASSDGSDDGGIGEGGSDVAITTSGNVSVTANGLTAPQDGYNPTTNDYATDTAPVSVPANLGKLQQSGVLVAVSKGGDGGSGPQTLGSGNNLGGVGADAGVVTTTVMDGAAITANGNYVAGIVELSFGGLGGDGREDSDGAIAGNGGAVGIEMDQGTSISTNGTNAYGVLARSQGGNGGDYIPSSGVLNFNSARAGVGGAGGELNLTFGDVVNDQLGSGVANASGRVSIRTAGDNSTGIIAQSIGGAGGNVGNSFDLFGQVGSSTGTGGAAGAVFVRGGVDVVTTGNAARGVVLQSIGGAGGIGGESSGLVVLGGSSGTGGAAGQTSALLAGTVQTQGTSAVGVLAQSIGGGGGVANSASGVVAVGGQGGTGGASAAAGVSFAGGSLSTAGDYAYGIEVQSIGGGGGDGGSAFSFAGLSSIPTVGVGGTGGVAGNGAAASATNIVNGLGHAFTLTTSGANAHGVLAQSIGGGGGSGGDANGGGLTIASFQIAGAGKAGGAGGTTNLSFDGLGLTTYGTHAAGLIAQSIGGGGGSGGSAYSHNTAAGFTLAVGVGGKGGTGGNGGNTTVDLTGTTITTGAGVGSNGQTGNTITDAFGIVAQSVGGGGGIGGSSTARAIDVAVPVDDVSFGSEVSVAVGGAGGTGGTGETVTVALDSTTIQTQGDGSIGIVAQSVGGGGGIGGSSDAIGRVLQQSEDDDEEEPTGEAADEGDGDTTTVSASVNVGVGGSGGSAGGAESVTVTLANGSSVTTYGENANAVLAQSIGGGGGLGAVGSAQTKGDTEEQLNLNIGVGGHGGGGGNAGSVAFELSEDSALTTWGDGSRGVVLQSIGGGGGASQSVSVDVGSSGLPVSASVSVGRQGADGGNGNYVSATFDGDVTTYGADADGILVQSIGGGGGLGGSAGGESGSDDDSDAAQAAAAEDDDSDSGININIAIAGSVGGKGGAGANGGAIGSNGYNPSAEFSLGGTVLTYGDYSDGVVVQTIGGGGGSGGNAASQDSEAQVKTNIVMGGVGGGGGDGSSIVLAFDNLAVQTQGAYAFGTLLQSIGAGGGQAGSGSKNSCGLISLGSGNSTEAYSGASAGCGTLPPVSSIRNQTGASGNGGNIATEGTGNVATIVTTGDDAHALVAQSIGGGGGTAGAGSSNSEGDQAFTVALGASGGTVGNGGTVTLDGTFKLSTTGARAIGLVAQSIGGGGGLATLDVSNADSGEVHLGADGANGSGAAVTLDLSDESIILTTGQAGHGVVAQSIGGGGGIAGDTSVSTLLTTDYTRNDATNSGNASGNGGNVTIDTAATIQVSGKGAIGVVAQSIAGGGGLGGDASGSFAGSTTTKAGSSVAGNVTVTNDGAITATGEHGIGIFAQSQGAEDNGIVVVNVNGTVTGGTGAQGTGIMIAGGYVGNSLAPGNALNVASGGTVGGWGGTAVIYQGDSNSATYSGLEVNNAGTISGNINGYYLDGSVISGLGDAAIALDATAGKAAVTVNNQKGGVLVDASSYGADVINAGSLIVGKADLPDTLQIAGAFTQTSTGVTTAAVDFFRGVGDLIKVSGQTTLDGALEIVPLTTYKGARQQIVDAEGEIAGAFSEIKSTLFDYALSTDEAGDLWVEVAGAHFKSVPNLTDNQQATAAYLGEVFDTKDVTLRELFAAAERVANADVDNYATMLSELSPGASAAGSALNIALAPGRFDPLMGCQKNADGSETDQSCVDVFAKGQTASQDGSNSALGFDSDIYSFGVAGHQAVEDYVLGASLSLESSSSTGSDGLSKADGDSVILGLSASRDFGGMTVTGALLGSSGSFDTTRTLALPTGTETARGSYDATSAALRVRLEYSSMMGAAYLRPMLDLDAIYTSAGGYTETGAGAENLKVQGSDESAFIATPALELGRVFDLGNGQGLRAYGRVGWTISSSDAYTTSARFAGAPSSVGGFDTALALPDSVGVIGAGAQLIGNDTMALDLRYDGAFGDGTSSNALSLWISKKF